MLRSYARRAFEEVIWIMWLFFHPFTRMSIDSMGAKYRRKRREVIRHFWRRISR